MNRNALPNDVLKNNENGYFIDNSSDLSEKIVLLLKNSYIVEKMGKKSLEMVEKFSWDNIGKSILDIYKEINLQN